MRQLKIQKRITDRNSIAISMYLKEINSYPLLSIAEEIRLFEQYKNGDNEAKTTLINSNLRFVVSVAEQYLYTGIPLEDLINEGNLGLIKAVEVFDTTRGFKFISYAVRWIRQSITTSISKNSNIVKLSYDKVKLAKKIAVFNNAYYLKYGYNPSIDIISEELEIKKKTVWNVVIADGKSFSLDSISPHDDVSVGETLWNGEKESYCDKESLIYDINRVLKELLSDKEANVLRHYFGIGCEEKSMQSIGNEMKICPERVRQLKESALNKLRYSNKIHILQKYI